MHTIDSSNIRTEVNCIMHTVVESEQMVFVSTWGVGVAENRFRISHHGVAVVVQRDETM
jgi:hypothetical protein